MANDLIELPIQGLWYYQGLSEFHAGRLKEEARIRLVLDSYNPHDKNAIEVRLARTDAKLGFVPKTQAVWISNLIRSGNNLPARIRRVGVYEKNNREHLHCIIEVELPSGSNPNYQSGDSIKRALNFYKGKCGIYEIFCCKTQKRYVGKSKDVGSRLKQHFEQLIQNRHHSEKLQRDWNQYLPSSFEFRVIEEVSDIDKLLEIEQSYINKYDSFNNGYNASPSVEYKPRSRWRRRKAIYHEHESHEVRYAPLAKEVASKSGCLSLLLIPLAVMFIVVLLVAAHAG